VREPVISPAWKEAPRPALIHGRVRRQDAAPYAPAVLTILLIAASVGLDNFAASIAIGLAGVDRSLRLRIAVVFGLFEAGMPVVGLVVGSGLAHTLGNSAHVVGGALLIATGAHGIVTTLRSGEEGGLDATLATGRLMRLIVLGAALSIDNLIVGFALGADHAALVPSIVAIGVVSVGLSLLGLELGARLGERVERYGELLGGIVLVGVGLALLTRLI
jgi:putative Mn2+ efflux pump MntP